MNLFGLLLLVCTTPSVTTSLLPAPITRPDAGFLSQLCSLERFFGRLFADVDGEDIHVARLTTPRGSSG